MNEEPPSSAKIILLLAFMLAYCYFFMYAAQTLSYLYFEGK